MDTLGFPTKFTGWILECVKTVNYTVLINGETTVPFDAAKGLRQEDPISPFLFAIVKEYLSRSLNGLKGINEFKYHPKSVKLGITHLSFVDDLLLIAKGDLPSVAAMHRCFSHFSQSSGLQANLGKSSVYFGGISPPERTRILQHLGRVQLVQSVVFGIQDDWAQLLPFPVKVLKLIDAYCRSYIWSAANNITKKALVSWENICSHKSSGGPNLVNIQLWNKVLPKQIFNARVTMNQVQRNNSGTSLTKHIYLQLLGDRPHVNWKCLMFQNNTRPKAQFTMWMLLHGRLLITDRLRQWGMAVETQCALCHDRDESREHLFVNCVFTKTLWRRSCTGCSTDKGQQILGSNTCSGYFRMLKETPKEPNYIGWFMQKYRMPFGLRGI
uniref:Reverse transcriptase domain-containing protein n=2 Tax=Nicotiana TaxID=4085 RepID=A0A1S3Y9S5_TOBAC|nr:PREDICTED: uncharacterized protein LOC104245194 [Nicotiana sylvestris]XP_016448778.1 PREDICTED: uncharacterized protein LOC107773866 [Nicotiana tabacum]